MKDITALICDSCGGHIDRDTLRCNHCGCEYRINSMGTLEMIISEKRIIYMDQSVIIPAEYVEQDPEKAMEYGLHQLAEALASRILPLSKWVHEYRFNDNSYILNMRVGIADPESSSSRRMLWKDY